MRLIKCQSGKLLNLDNVTVIKARGYGPTTGLVNEYKQYELVAFSVGGAEVRIGTWANKHAAEQTLDYIYSLDTEQGLTVR